MFRSKRRAAIIPGIFLTLAAFLCLTGPACQSRSKREIGKEYSGETAQEREARMAWWKEARFGMFIHWGLYAVPAGEWNGETNHAEWIRTTAQIPLEEYDRLSDRFDPVDFNASEWVQAAKQAGMKYIVITSKHHDGFSIFDSKVSDFDVIDATPFKRDILKELAEECRKQGLKMCFYHSIMDWHHPDYLPRRNWETQRTAEGAVFKRYIEYMKEQVRELLTHYGPIGVMWFDGEWESTWTPEFGSELYKFVRTLQPEVIVNNRVSTGRAGMAGTYNPEIFAGDFGTPEQEIPATGLDYDWETCMTMNRHWGYNRHDSEWKTSEQLIRMLVDISSKGGNFLLNVGPTAEGTFPRESLTRLAEIGAWMEINGESIYETSSSRFESLPWGRSTTKGSTLYFHVFDWPEDGRLAIPGLLTPVKKAFMLSARENGLETEALPGEVVIFLPGTPPDRINSVIACEFEDRPDVVNSPKIQADGDIFISEHPITLSGEAGDSEIRYTLDGREPEAGSPLYTQPILLDRTAEVACRLFRYGTPVSAVTRAAFTKVPPRPAVTAAAEIPGLNTQYFEGEWEKIPDFSKISVAAASVTDGFGLEPAKRPENYALQFSGFIRIPDDEVYTFHLTSDDGSRMWIGEKLVVDNDGLHGSEEKQGRIALAEGLHPITVEFIQRTGGAELTLEISAKNLTRSKISTRDLVHQE